MKKLGAALLSLTLALGSFSALASTASEVNAQPYRSKDISLFAGKNLEDDFKGDAEIMGDMPGFRIPSLLRSVTADPNDSDVLVAAIDQSDNGSDWGDVNISVRRSFDNGQTWSDVKTVLDLPASNTIGEKDVPDWRAAFYIDPAITQAPNGDLVMMVDMWPECGGLHKYDWLDDGSGTVTIEGKTYQALYTGRSRVGNRPYSLKGKTFTVRENGWIYDNKGNKTNYYLPQNHSGEYAYQTMGDLYYAVGEADYLSDSPPLIPENPENKPEGQNDIYTGNIYLNYKKPSYKSGAPRFVQKVQRTADEENVSYDTLQTSPAPLFAPVTAYLWVSTSSDNGETWSQPTDVTSQIKQDDERFLGLGPGVGLTLQHQQDESKNGRILMPLYNLGIATVVYSDDNGKTWKRCDTDGYGYINNVDEAQLIELEDGTVMSFGRQTENGPTPVSYSPDGGESWSVQRKTELTSVKCQKSVITYPMDSTDPRFAYCEGMTEGKQYVLSSHPSGTPENPNARSNGVISLGEVQEDNTIRWIAERRLEMNNTVPDKDGNAKYFAYSCLTVLEDGTIGILAEAQSYNYAAFGTFNLEWIFKGETEGTVSPPQQASPDTVTLNSIFMDIKKDGELTAFVKPGVTLEFTVQYSDSVNADSTSALPFTLDKKELRANYVSGSGTKTLTYSYEVQKGDTSKEYPLITAHPSAQDNSIRSGDKTFLLTSADGYTVYDSEKPYNAFALSSWALRLAAYGGPFLGLAVIALIAFIITKVKKHIKKKKQTA